MGQALTQHFSEDTLEAVRPPLDKGRRGAWGSGAAVVVVATDPEWGPRSAPS